MSRHGAAGIFALAQREGATRAAAARELVELVARHGGRIDPAAAELGVRGSVLLNAAASLGVELPERRVGRPVGARCEARGPGEGRCLRTDGHAGAHRDMLGEWECEAEVPVAGVGEERRRRDGTGD